MEFETKIFGTEGKCQSGEACASQQTWGSMAKLYVKAATDLIEVAGEQDELAPAIFLARHALELTIKQTVLSKEYKADLYSYEDGPSYKEIVGHDLLKFVADLAFNSDLFEFVDLSHVLEFHKQDPDSFSYRYPVNKKNEELCKNACCVSASEILSMLQGLSLYLEGFDTDTDAEKVKQSN